jgi:hypothetical protein
MNAVFKVMLMKPSFIITRFVVDSETDVMQEAIDRMMQLRNDGKFAWVEPFYDGDPRLDPRYYKKVG